MTRVCCTVSLGTGFNKVSFIKFSKKICALLENIMHETGKLLARFCSVHLVVSFFFNCYMPLRLFAFVF